MFSYSFTKGLLCAGLLFSLPVVADSSKPWADVAVPVTSYSSPLADYQRHSPQTPGNWREANDTVGRIGGWQAYAAEVWEASRSSEGEHSEEEIPPRHHDH
jgi:hypothetical protein